MRRRLQRRHIPLVSRGMPKEPTAALLRGSYSRSGLLSASLPIARWRVGAIRSARSMQPLSAAVARLQSRLRKPNEWIRGLITTERSSGHGQEDMVERSEHRLLMGIGAQVYPRNPFAGVKVTVPKKVRLRETRAFRPQEARTILQAASAITDTRSPTEAAKRWVPWLCAYTGARPGEMAQLRKIDVIKEEGIPVLQITPEAGTVKGSMGAARSSSSTPYNSGFLKFVAQHVDRPLFYSPDVSTPTMIRLQAKEAALFANPPAAWQTGCADWE